MKDLPRHIAIIMDGNGRWARRRSLPRVKGHAEGARAVRRTVEAARRIGIKFLTLYSFSTENWKRSPSEINFLFSMLSNYIDLEKKTMHKNKIALRTIGNISILPRKVREKLESAVRETSKGRKMTLVLALNYGSRDEIMRAVKDTVRKSPPPGKALKTFEKNLDTSFMPDPDLVIRTSGEMRLSNFLLYQAAYSEFYFTKTLWPDFGARQLKRAIAAFGKRKRRYGGY